MCRRIEKSKSIQILLALCIIISFSVALLGCSSRIDKDTITGIWSASWEYQGNSFSSIFELTANGEYEDVIYKNGQLSDVESGTYEIKGNGVTLHKDGDSKFNMEFKYSNGKLINGDHAFTKEATAVAETTAEVKAELTAEDSENINAQAKETTAMIPIEKISAVLEARTVSALNNEVAKQNWSSEIDVGMCTYTISQMKIEGKNYVVYGTLYLKDAYNHPTSKYKDGSGGSSVDFQAKFDSECDLVSINLK